MFVIVKNSSPHPQSANSKPTVEDLSADSRPTIAQLWAQFFSPKKMENSISYSCTVT